MQREAPFISFEGIDGCGKTTILDRVALELTRAGHPVRKVRDPGTTLIGEHVRILLADPKVGSVDPWAELLLYLASRLELLRRVIEPSLAQGIWILSDRFTDASLAYQGYGRRLGSATIRQLFEMVHLNRHPDLTVLLDCSVETALRRVHRTRTADRMERESLRFFERVRRGYLECAAADLHRFVIVDASPPVEDVLEKVLETLRSRIPNLGFRRNFEARAEVTAIEDEPL